MTKNAITDRADMAILTATSEAFAEGQQPEVAASLDVEEGWHWSKVLVEEDRVCSL